MLQAQCYCNVSGPLAAVGNRPLQAAPEDHAKRTPGVLNSAVNATTETDPTVWLDEHGDALYAFAMMRLSNSAAAEDMVQETLLAALSAVTEFESRARVRTWLIGILKNKIIDYLRKSGRETSYDPEQYDEGDAIAEFDARGHWPTAPSDWGDPARVAENEALGDTMMNCIEHLPDKLRAPFVLREIDGLSTDEIVDALGISSSNNLWVILSRGRERVRKCVENNWFGAAAQ